MKAADLPPILREFGVAPETGQSPTQDIPVPKEIARLREREAKRIAALEKVRLTGRKATAITADYVIMKFRSLRAMIRTRMNTRHVTEIIVPRAEAKSRDGKPYAVK